MGSKKTQPRTCPSRSCSSKAKPSCRSAAATWHRGLAAYGSAFCLSGHKVVCSLSQSISQLAVNKSACCLFFYWPITLPAVYCTVCSLSVSLQPKGTAPTHLERCAVIALVRQSCPFVLSYVQKFPGR
ncbi:hypothetical protein DUNSADRAFT_15716 [Dunaliella salina]|uniref:Encoded protein n=1 Tax=Dunaliella salina TaxID=3046 RepID=A0ABQ7G4V5_DUNSA|nr:hypothetical protein DUNSADRAFT_15716 [Dunaliella salina]|eukprot:KAF5829632.1 hypothetical protein DUNSADRAFT_15716 [Dunaliella salina]